MDGRDETETARAILWRYGLRLVALTRGPRGSQLITTSQVSEHRAEPVKVVDTVGAGDAFTAALVVGICRGHALGFIHDAASRLAAYVCTQPGATPPVPPEVLAGAWPGAGEDSG